MTPRSDRPHGHALGIPRQLLIACAPFGPRLPAVAVASAIACGVEDGGQPEPDVCVLPFPDAETGNGEHVRRLLDELDFDERMRRARALVVAAERLEERTLAGSVTFEIATRARQSGVPAYAITRHNALNAFDARILDLQLIVEAHGRAELVAAGLELARLA